MSFDIAVYNKGCKDINQMINSLKAAYLYSDKIRIYDCLFSLEQDEKNLTEKLSKNKKLQKLREEYPSLKRYNISKIEDLTSMIEELEEIAKPYIQGDRFKMLLNSCSYQEFSRLSDEAKQEKYNSLMGELGISKDEFYFESYKLKNNVKIQKYLLECDNVYLHLQNFECYQLDSKLREICSTKYSIDDYRTSIGLIGADFISPDIFPEDVSVSPDVFEERFFDDRGFKIINNPRLISNSESILPSLWVPSSLAEYSFSVLPGFEDATIDEIIDIRKELDKYIVPYRAAMLKMAREIKNIPDTESLQRECMMLYLRDIEPQVASINAAIADNNVIRNIVKSIITNEKTWISMGALATAFVTKGDIANALSVGTALTFGGQSIAKSIMSTLEEKKKIKDNEMFFLYQVGKKLKK